MREILILVTQYLLNRRIKLLDDLFVRNRELLNYSKEIARTNQANERGHRERICAMRPRSIEGQHGHFRSVAERALIKIHASRWQEGRLCLFDTFRKVEARDKKYTIFLYHVF